MTRLTTKTARPEFIRSLTVNYNEGATRLVLLDEGQDFEFQFAEWCSLDDASCDGRLPKRCGQESRTFLTERGVTVLFPSTIQALRDFYGMDDWRTEALSA